MAGKKLDPQASDGFEQARAATLALLGARAPEATICPSEVARALAASAGDAGGAEDWTGAMPAVHAAIDRLIDEGLVRLSWKGEAMPRRKGPYRIGGVAKAKIRPGS